MTYRPRRKMAVDPNDLATMRGFDHAMDRYGDLTVSFDLWAHYRELPDPPPAPLPADFPRLAAFGMPANLPDREVTFRDDPDWLDHVVKGARRGMPRPMTVTEWCDTGAYGQTCDKIGHFAAWLPRLPGYSHQRLFGDDGGPGDDVRAERYSFSNEQQYIGLPSVATPANYPVYPLTILTGTAMTMPRALSILGMFTEEEAAAAPLIVSSMSVDLGQALRAAEATPVLLPGEAITALLGSEPPDQSIMDNVRLPFEATLVYFDATAVPDITGFEVHNDPLDVDDQHPASIAIEKVGAVVLYADSEGRLEPIGNVLCTGRPAGEGPDAPATLSCSMVCWEHSALRDAVYNIAAMLCYGKVTDPWTVRPDIATEVAAGGRRERKALKSSVARKAMEMGGFHGVRVLRLFASGKAVDRSTQETLEAHRARPGAHFRKAHWRRSRIGARADWPGWEHAVEKRHFEVHWLAPKLVNADQPLAPGRRVYKAS